MTREPLSHRFGIVLAAGNGIRIQSFIKDFYGNNLPKQYVNFIGKRSMLEHTFHRMERLIRSERIYTVISENHLFYPEVRHQLSSRMAGTVILQPENKDTGPGLLLPLVYLHYKNPDGIVVIFPSDHFIVEEELFIKQVEFAFQAVEQNQSVGILLGVQPDEPETEYGYILPIKGRAIISPSKIHKIAEFIEKPSVITAKQLISKGALWNTMVMVFKVKTLLNLFKNVDPILYTAFENIGKGIGSSSERKVISKTYRVLNPLNFSRGILQVVSQCIPSNLGVLPVTGVQWSDWGNGLRIMDALRKYNLVCKNGKLLTNQITKKIGALT
ncbi:MAG: sugar phosphate nucleotidyltransferase [Nitrospiria bacterium]